MCRCPNGAPASCVDTASFGTCTCPALEGVGQGVAVGPPGLPGAIESSGGSTVGLSVLVALPGWPSLLGVCVLAFKMALCTKSPKPLHTPTIRSDYEY